MWLPFHLRSPAVDGSGAATDPNWANVVLLIGNDSKANLTTTFTDQSASAHAMTTAGAAKYDTSSAPTGLTSSILVANNADYITTPSSTDFNFGTGNFTFELYYLCPAVIPTFGTLFDTGAQAFSAVFNSPASQILFVINTVFVVTATHSMTAGNWYHLAWVRSGNSQYIFQNGVQIGSTGTSAASVNASATTYIAEYSGSQTFSPKTNIASIRLTKGVARYTSTFTPPTLPFPTS